MEFKQAKGILNHGIVVSTPMAVGQGIPGIAVEVQ